MNLQIHRTIFNIVLGIVTFFYLSIASAQVPGSIARLSYIGGPVTFSPAGTNKWIFAKYNRPLITGDRLWTDTNAKAELQLGRATVRLGAKTSVNIINLNNRIGQFQLTQGTFYLRVWSIKEGQIYEIDTPNLAFVVKRPGAYRLDVDANKKITKISVREGQGEIYAAKASYLINKKHSCVFYGTSLNRFKCSARLTTDDFERWCFKRNSRMENAISSRYVSREIIGYEDLDNHGSWRTTAKYGSTWFPSKVSHNWAPYRNGHWTWINTWGWTWVDDQAWGFAPSHYGRWANINGNWGWIPPRKSEALYAPALVVFVESGNARSRDIAWFPIGPGEVYVPPYSVSPDYFISININNTNLNDTYVRRAYNHRHENINYINRRIPNAVTMVPTRIFARSQEINKAAIPVSTKILEQTKIIPVASVAPIPASVVGETKPANIAPPEKVLTQDVIAKTAPPPPPVPFDVVQSKLAEQPGKPLTPQEVTDLKQSTPATIEQIKVVNPTQPPVPISKEETPSDAEQQAPTTLTPTTTAPLNQPEAPPSQPVAPAPKENAEPKIQQPVEVPHPPESKTTPEQPIERPEVTPSQPAEPAPTERVEPETPPSMETPRPPESKSTPEQPIERPEVTPSQPAEPAPTERVEPETPPSMETPRPPESNSTPEQPIERPEVTPSQPAEPAPTERVEPETPHSMETPRPPESNSTPEQSIERPEITPSQPTERVEPEAQPSMEAPNQPEPDKTSEQIIERHETTPSQPVEPEPTEGAEPETQPPAQIPPTREPETSSEQPIQESQSSSPNEPVESHTQQENQPQPAPNAPRHEGQSDTHEGGN